MSSRPARSSPGGVRCSPQDRPRRCPEALALGLKEAAARRRSPAGPPGRHTAVPGNLPPIRAMPEAVDALPTGAASPGGGSCSPQDWPRRSPRGSGPGAEGNRSAPQITGRASRRRTAVPGDSRPSRPCQRRWAFSCPAWLSPDGVSCSPQDRPRLSPEALALELKEAAARRRSSAGPPGRRTAVPGDLPSLRAVPEAVDTLPIGAASPGGVSRSPQDRPRRSPEALAPELKEAAARRRSSAGPPGWRTAVPGDLPPFRAVPEAAYIVPIFGASSCGVSCSPHGPAQAVPGCSGPGAEGGRSTPQITGGTPDRRTAVPGGLPSLRAVPEAADALPPGGVGCSPEDRPRRFPGGPGPGVEGNRSAPQITGRDSRRRTAVPGDSRPSRPCQRRWTSSRSVRPLPAASATSPQDRPRRCPETLAPELKKAATRHKSLAGPPGRCMAVPDGLPPLQGPAGGGGRPPAQRGLSRRCRLLPCGILPFKLCRK